MSDYFYCHECDRCRHKEEFPLCDLCDEFIIPTGDICRCGYVCEQHIGQIDYEGYEFTVCYDCHDLLRKKDKDTLKKINEKIEEKKEKEEDSDESDSDE